MGSRRDRIANEKIVDFFVPQNLTPGTHSSGVFDLRNAPAVVGAPGGGVGREIITNMLLQFSVVEGTGGAGGWVVTPRVLTGNTAATLTLFATTVLPMATGDGEDLYLVEIRDLQRYIRLDLVVANHGVLICVLGNGERSRREPVFQLGTELVVTYAKNPAGVMTGP